MKAEDRVIAEVLRKAVSFSKESALFKKPSKLRVAGSIPAAPTNNPVISNDVQCGTSVAGIDEPSASERLSGEELRNNCGTLPIRLISLASSSLANCTAIVAGGMVVVVDAGISRRETIARLSDLGVLTKEKPAPDALLVTHEHSDHAKYIHQWLQHSQPIYATAGTARKLECIGSTAWNMVVAGEPIRLAPGVVATAAAVSHDAAEPIAWRVAYAGAAAVVATDLGRLPEGWDLFTRGATDILIEANYHPRLLASCDYLDALKTRIGSADGHMSVLAVAEWVRDRLPTSVERLFVGHISRKCCDVAIVRHLMTEALAGRPGVALEVLEA